MTNFVTIKFHGSQKSYVYLSDLSAEVLKNSSHAIVQSPYSEASNSDRLVVVAIESVDETRDASSYTGKYKHLISVFNLNEYNQRLEREARAKVLEARLRERIKEQSFIKNASAMLEGDEEGLKMLEELKNLTNNQ